MWNEAVTTARGRPGGLRGVSDPRRAKRPQDPPRLCADGGPGHDLVILNDIPATFARAIVLDGVRLIREDPDVDHAFVRDKQLRAADLEPFLARMRAVKLGRLRA